MIPAERLQKLKQLFAEDGITLTDAEALEIGLWLVERVRPVLAPVPLDKLAQFAIIRSEAKAFRDAMPFINLHEWRRKNVKDNPSSPSPDVSP